MRAQKDKTRVAYQATHLHVCKINTPHARTYPYEVSAMKRSSLQPVVP